MRITGLRTTLVTQRFKENYRWRLGSTLGITSVLVELDTDAGITGYGESPCFFPPGEAFQAAVESLGRFVVGEEPFDHERIYKRILGFGGLYYDRVFGGFVSSGIDLALWDLIGKATEQPLYRLLGGRVHQDSRFIAIVPLGDTDEVAELAEDRVNEGCQTLYLKYDGDEEALVERLAAIRSRVGREPGLRVDFNQGLSAGYAVKLISELERFDLEAVEQPCSEFDFEGMAYVRQSTTTPIISDESSKTVPQAMETVRQGAADIIQISPCTADGVWGARKTAGIAEAAGLPVVLHSVGELGLNQAKNVHLAVSTPNASLANQTLYDYLEDDIIVDGPMPFSEWAMTPVEEPGLGVQIDQEKVREAASRYQETKGLYITTQENMEALRNVTPLMSGRASRVGRGDVI